MSEEKIKLRFEWDDLRESKAEFPKKGSLAFLIKMEYRKEKTEIKQWKKQNEVEFRTENRTIKYQNKREKGWNARKKDGKIKYEKEEKERKGQKENGTIKQQNKRKRAGTPKKPEK